MNPTDEMPPGWPVIQDQTFGLGTRQEMTLTVVEPPISEIEIKSRQWYLAGYRAAKAGTTLACCGLTETEHPTYPTASGHEFGLHFYPFRGCAACVQFVKEHHLVNNVTRRTIVGASDRDQVARVRIPADRQNPEAVIRIPVRAGAEVDIPTEAEFLGFEPPRPKNR
jgi:hypothetical protein